MTTLMSKTPARLRLSYHSIRALNNSTTTTPSSSLPKPSQQHPENHNLPSLSLWSTIREAKPAVRWTVYAGLGIMATVESTFWFNVIKAKFFPSASAEEKEKADEFLDTIQAAASGYRLVWMRNYNRYYGAHLWGLGYGGLDGLDSDV